MMTALALFVGLVLFCFAFVLLFGAPYVPTLDKQVETALDLLDLQPGQTMLELGCGDGKVLIAAAHRGWHAVGYELNPVLALIAWVRTRHCRDKAKVVWGNFWDRPWPEADGIFVFLLDKFMVRLDMAIIAQSKRPIRLVSFAFQVPGRQELTARDGIFLYVYQK